MKASLFATVLAGAILFSLTPSWAKTVKECNAEYAANKEAIKGTQKKADFITACRAGTEIIPGGAAAAPAAPAPAPTQTAAPAPAPQAPPPAPAPAAPRTHPTVAASPSGANEYTSDTAAKAHCPSDTVVWVNTHSHIYHFAGHRDYGNTKSGAYMCEAEANSAGNRAPLNEKHP